MKHNLPICAITTYEVTNKMTKSRGTKLTYNLIYSTVSNNCNIQGLTFARSSHKYGLQLAPKRIQLGILFIKCPFLHSMITKANLGTSCLKSQ